MNLKIINLRLQPHLKGGSSILDVQRPCSLLSQWDTLMAEWFLCWLGESRLDAFYIRKPVGFLVPGRYSTMGFFANTLEKRIIVFLLQTQNGIWNMFFGTNLVNLPIHFWFSAMWKLEGIGNGGIGLLCGETSLKSFRGAPRSREQPPAQATGMVVCCCVGGWRGWRLCQGRESLRLSLAEPKMLS